MFFNDESSLINRHGKKEKNLPLTLLLMCDNAGQTPMTATTAGVAARAGDGVADEVTATGVQTVDPGRNVFLCELYQNNNKKVTGLSSDSEQSPVL